MLRNIVKFVAGLGIAVLGLALLGVIAVSSIIGVVVGILD